MLKKIYYYFYITNAGGEKVSQGVILYSNFETCNINFNIEQQGKMATQMLINVIPINISPFMTLDS